jgi:hypothetical protein
MPRLYTPQIEKRHLRICIFGKGGVGKSHLAYSGPKPVGFDVEGKIQSFVQIFPDIRAVDFNKINIVREYQESVAMAMDGRFQDCETFVLDSWKVLETAYKATMDYDVDHTQQGKLARGRQRERIEQDLLDPIKGTTKCHLVYITHEANAWSEPGDGKLHTTGKCPDATRNFDHYFDLVIHLQYDAQRRRRFAVVTKSNYQQLFPVGMVIEDPTWETFMPIIHPRAATTPAAGSPTATGRQTAAAQPNATAAPSSTQPDVPVAPDGGPLLTNAEMKALYVEIDQPDGTLTAFLAKQGIPTKDVTAADRAKASGLLRRLAADKQRAAASVAA